VLRKNIKLLSNNSNNAMNSSDICGTDHNDDEIDVCTGQFINQGLSTGIVNSLNRIHIAGYKSMASGVITATNVCGGGGYNNSSPFACSSGSGAGGLLAPTNGTCVDWGNPLSEMYHEAMRYFAGKTVASTDYAVDDSAATAVIANLGQATWDATSDPLPSTEWCALSSIIVLSTGLTSLDNASITSDIAGLAPATLTDAVGTAEGISGHSYLIGSNGVTSNGICSAKTISNLSSASGICPELPHMKGGFLIAGLANANRSVDLRPGYLTNRTQRWASINANWVARQPLGTYTVGLAENLPSFEVTVGSGKINLVPACRSSGANNCSMTDLVVVQQTAKKGNFLISWEDGTAGGDYDMDVISRIQYCVGPDADGCNDAGVSTSQIKVTVSIEQAATGASPMELGYTVTGTSADGTVYPIKVPGTAACDPTACSDGNGGTAANNDMPNDRYFSLLTPSPSARCNVINTTNWPACPNGGPQLPIGVGTGNDTIGCPSGSDCGCPKTTLYTQSATPAGLLENPLWYAAKYGAPSTSWDVKNNVTGALGADGKPDNYFDVRNPANLYTSLEDVFDAASQPDASASSVATNSTNLQTASRVFQAKFSSADWSGQLLSFKFNAGTTALSGTPDWDAGTQINSQNPSTGRVILTKGSSGSGAAFSYSNLSTAGQGSLNTDYLGYVDNCGAERVAYLRGSQTNEGASGTFSCASPSTSIINKFRPRNTSRLGDVVNSSPWYVGEPKAGFSDVDHPGYTAFRVARKNRLPVVYVGGNDGMLHGFDASLNYSSTSSGRLPRIPAMKFWLMFLLQCCQI
jgi:type IV pilus assembly protein PilY1